MQITKVHCSRSLSTMFHDRFKTKYNLESIEETDIKSPLILFGCYTQTDVNRALKQKNIVVVAWMGSDSIKMDNIKQFVGKTNIFHISQSHWITNDLKAQGITPIELPISCVDVNEWKPCPLGDKIYIYTSATQPEKYGSEIYHKLIKEFGRDKFIIANYQTYTKDQLKNDIYPQVKFGIRLTEHDGLSESVAELGLMGRLVIHNGRMPNCKNYFSRDYIFELTSRFLNINKLDFSLRATDAHLDTYEYLTISNDWLNTEYYGRR